MGDNNSHITFQEIINTLDNDIERGVIFARLKQEEPIDDDVKGLKLFLEENDYDVEKLKLFLKSSEVQFETLLYDNDTKSTHMNWLKVAAVLIPLFTIGSYFFFFSESQNDKLYAQFYEREIGLPVTLSDNHNKLFDESMNLFRNEEFESSLKGFQQLLIDQPKNDTLHYFIGVCLLETGKVDKSINEFSMDYKGSIYKEKSQYLQALAYIKIRQTKEAKNILIEISRNKNHRYYTQSKELLQDELFN